MSVLSDLHKSGISVSDIASQYWCELQMENNYKYGQKITKAMKGGKQIHAELEEETNVPIILQPKSYPDALYKNIYTSLEGMKALKKNKRTREIQVYGSLGGYRVVGKIDKLEHDGNQIIVSEDKTRSNSNVPSDAQQLVHKIQVMVYKKMLEDLRSGDYGFQNFEASYKTSTMELTDEFKRQLDAIKVEKQMQTIGAVAKVLFENLRSMDKISDDLYIKYIDQFSGKEIKMHKVEYKKEEMDEVIKYILKYWNGERKAMPVPENESWKCKFCVFFGKECKVWWNQKAL